MECWDIVVYKEQIGRLTGYDEEKGVWHFSLPITTCACRRYFDVHEADLREATHEEKLDFLREDSMHYVITFYCIMNYQIAKMRDSDGRIVWYPYVNYNNAHRIYSSFDAALAGCLRYKYEGPNGKMDYYFCKMVGIEF